MVPLVISILAALLTLVYVGTVLFLRKGWLSIPDFIPSVKGRKTSVSILIAARNEEDKIAFTIEDVLSQSYPAALTELIIIDDHSADRTSEIVSSYFDRGVKLIRLNEKEKLNSYKKKAITEAIAIANGELIITTDADCRMHSHWLETVVDYYESHGSVLVSSPVIYHDENSFFERLQTLEFLYLIGLGAASIGNGMPSTCNGANLAYRKDVFYELGGFKGIDDLASGDDELFMHKVASAYPERIGFCKSSDAVVFTAAKPTLTEFIRQRKRWASKSTRYKNRKIVALGLSVWFFNLLILLTALSGLYNQVYWNIAIIALLLKFLSEFAFLVPVTKFAKRRELLWYLPLLTVIHIIYIVYIGIAGNSGKYVWKGRLVR